VSSVSPRGVQLSWSIGQFCQMVSCWNSVNRPFTFLKNLSNDQVTFLLIDGWISALQKHGRLRGLDGVRMHHLFEDITNEFLGDTVTLNLTPSFGTKALGELLFRRLKRLL